MNPSEVEILLVDDNAADVELTLHVLRKAKLVNTVHVVRDGAEALDYLFCQGNYSSRGFYAPRVVFLDLNLPKVNGLEVLKAIRSDDRTRLLPVVLMTSSAQEKDIINGYELGVNSYVQKPVDFVQFQKVVQELSFYWLVVNHTPPSP